MMEPLLSIENLSVSFFTNGQEIRAVDGVDLNILAQETLGLVGESGCGKSALALSILNLIPHPPGRIKGGIINFKGRDLLHLSHSEIRAVRGKEISMIFQEPMTSLNPVFTIGMQLMEGIRLHQKTGKEEARRLAIEMLKRVGIPSPEERLLNYPHQLSGGMRQRVMIAMSLALRPSFLIADEPTTALDMTIQAQILDLLLNLKDELKMSILLITHDLGIISEVTDRVAIMYLGKIVEKGETMNIFEKPTHPYTIGLLNSIPEIKHLDESNRRLKTISGVCPVNTGQIPGCGFADRCPVVSDVCLTSRPQLQELEKGHWVRCWNIQD